MCLVSMLISFSTFLYAVWRVDGIVLVLILLEYQYSHVGKEECCSLATGKVNIPNAVLLWYQKCHLLSLKWLVDLSVDIHPNIMASPEHYPIQVEQQGMHTSSKIIGQDNNYRN